MADSNELKFILRLQDQASAAMNGFGSTVESLSSMIRLQTAALTQMNETLSGMAGKHHEAASAVKEHGEAHKEAAEGAKEHAEEELKVGQSLERVARQAKEAAEAMLGLWASNEMARGTIEAAEESEKSILRIARASGQSKEAVEELDKQLAELSSNNGGFATTQQMEKMAVAAARLGGTNEQIKAFSNAISLIGSEGNFEQLSTGIGKVLQATGEGVGGVTKLTDALAAMEKNSIGGIGALLPMMEHLSAQAADLGLSSAHIAAFAAMFERLGGRPEMNMMAFSRTMQMLKKDAESGGNELNMLAKQAGMTAGEFAKMAQAKPEEAFLKLLEVVKKLQDSGADPTNFLSRVGISNEQVSVIASMAKQLDDLKGKLDQVDNSGGAAKKLAAGLNTDFDDALKGLTDEWEAFKKQIGNDEMDTVVMAFHGLTAAMKEALKLFEAIDPSTRLFFEALVIGTPAVLGITKGIGAMIETLSGATEFIALCGGKIGALADAAVAGAARMIGFGSAVKVAGEESLAATAGVKAVEAELGLAGGAAEKAGLRIGALIGKLGMYYLAYQGAKALGGIGGELANEYLPDSVKGALVDFRENTNLGRGIKRVGGWMGLSTPEQKEEAKKQKEEAEKKSSEAENAGAARFSDATVAGHLRGRSGTGQDHSDAAALNAMQAAAPEKPAATNMLSKEVHDALASLDEYSKKQNDLILLQEKLNKATELLKQGDTNDFSAQQLQLMQQKLNYEKMMADPLQAESRALGDQVNAARAFTKEQQNRLTVEKEIRKLEEEGALNASTPNDAAHQQVRSGMEAGQEAEKQKSFQEQLIAMNNQLAIAGALTQAEKDRLQVEQQIAALEKSMGLNPANPEDAKKIAQLQAILEATKKVNEQNAQFKSLNPQANAIQNYNDQLAIMNERLAQGRMSQEEFNREKAKLDQDTLASRDPLGNLAQQQQEELDKLKVTGQYREADLKTLQEMTELKKQGITLDQQSQDALKNGNRNIQDIQDMQKNLESLESSFGSGLSNAIQGALAGNRHAFSQFGLEMGKKMMDQAFSSLTKQLEPGVNSLLGGMFGKAQGGIDALKGMGKSQMEHTIQSAQTTIHSASVTVNGAVAGAAGATAAGASGGFANSGAYGNLSGSAEAVGGAGGAISPSSLAIGQQLSQHLQSTYGLTAAQASGAVGSMAYESGNFTTLQEKNPAVPGSRGGYGYAQWTGPRRDQFEAFAKQNGLDPSSYAAQQGFMDQELHGQYAGAISALKSTSNPTDASHAWMKSYEGMSEGGPGVPALAAHAQRSEQFYSAMNGGAQRYSGGSVAAPSVSSAGATVTSSKDVLDHLQDMKSRGMITNDECVSLATGSVGIKLGSSELGGHTGEWQPLDDASAGTLKPGTPIASFMNRQGTKSSQYGQGSPGGGGERGAGLDHAAVFDGYVRDDKGNITGMNVDEQYAASHGQIRQAQYQFGKGYGEHNASNYSAIGVTGGGYLGNTQNPMSPKALGFDNGSKTYDADSYFPKNTMSMDDWKAAHGLQAGTDSSPVAIDLTHIAGNQISPQTAATAATTDQASLMRSLNAQQGSGNYGGGNLFGGGSSGSGGAGSSDPNSVDFGQVGGQLAGLGEKGLAMADPAAAPYVSAFSQLSKLFSPLTKLFNPAAGATSAATSAATDAAASAATDAATGLAADSGGLFGGLGSLFGLVHTGGVIGSTPGMGMSRRVSPAVFRGAPRFHDGLTDDEFPAILQRGERVLTANQDSRASATMASLVDKVSKQQPSAGSQSGQSQGSGGGARSVVFNVTSPNAGSFKYSQPQLMAQMASGLQRSSAKHN